MSARNKVLVVDDEPRILTAVEDVLEDEFDVLTTTDPESALRIAESEEVAVVLSDQRMPGVTGDQLLGRVREISQATRLLITGYADLDALTRAINQGQIYAYIAKPWSSSELRGLIGKAVAHYELVCAVEYERGLLQALMDNLPDPISFRDRETRFTRINRAHAALLGVKDPADCVGRLESEFLPPARAELRRREDEEILATGKPLVDKIEQFETPDGKERWYSVTRIPITVKPGAITGIATVARDITNRRQLEEQLRQAQKMEALGRLTGGIAHDFNNLLTVINGYSEMLLQEQLTMEVRESIQEVLRAADRAAALTRQLLAFSRRQVLQPKIVGLNSIIANLSRMLERMIGEDIQLVRILEPGLWDVNADSGQLEQVLMNLVVNSRDALPSGGKITIRTANVPMRSAVLVNSVDLNTGDYVLMSVSDTGHGMSQETISRLFEPFFTTKEVGKGTGLGLSTVYGIIKQSGGEIAVKSELGIGTEFSIYLPRALDSGAADGEGADGQRAQFRETGTVLLVEDDVTVRELAAKILQQSGHQVFVARDCEEALDIFERHRRSIQMLISDVIMPRGTGHELARKIRERKPEIAVLLISGYTPASFDYQKALEEGIPFLQKPFTVADLISKVGEILRTVQTG